MYKRSRVLVRLQICSLIMKLAPRLTFGSTTALAGNWNSIPATGNLHIKLAIQEHRKSNVGQYLVIWAVANLGPITERVSFVIISSHFRGDRRCLYSTVLFSRLMGKIFQRFF